MYVYHGYALMMAISQKQLFRSFQLFLSLHHWLDWCIWSTVVGLDVSVLLVYLLQPSPDSISYQVGTTFMSSKFWSMTGQVNFGPGFVDQVWRRI